MRAQRFARLLAILNLIALTGCADYAYNRGCWSPPDKHGKCR